MTNIMVTLGLLRYVIFKAGGQHEQRAVQQRGVDTLPGQVLPYHTVLVQAKLL